MTEARIATFSGGTAGLIDQAVTTTAEPRALNSPARAETALSLNPEHPFGITFIIGGTNVRFCVSHPGSDKPSIQAWKWQELQNELQETLNKTGSSFGQSKELVFSSIAGKFVDFLDSHFAGLPGGAPLEKLCAFNFSVAGIVTGEGNNAEVSTSNTGVIMKEERIAVSMLDAINKELAARKSRDVSGSRKHDSIQTNNVAVMNDAAAGLMGEKIGGGLQGVTNGLFVIVGTGVGSFGLVDGKLDPRFAELGHIMVRAEKTEEYELVTNSSIGSVLAAEGGFKALSTDAPYAENELAGPWAASKFAKRIRENYRVLFPLLQPEVYRILAEKAIREGKQPRPEDEVKADLVRIIDLNYGEMEKWAVSAPSDVLAALNQLLFSHNATEIAGAVECGGVTGIIQRADTAKDKEESNLEEAAKHREEANQHLEMARAYEERAKGAVLESPMQYQMMIDQDTWQKQADRSNELANKYEVRHAKYAALHKENLAKAFTHARWLEFQAYTKELAKFLKASYKAMDKRGCAPEKIVVAGGIGELLNRLTTIPTVQTAERQEANKSGDQSHHLTEDSDAQIRAAEDLLSKKLLKEKIDWLFLSNAVDIPPGVIQFSSMSPEAREAAVTTQQVKVAFESYIEKLGRPNLDSFESSVIM